MNTQKLDKSVQEILLVLWKRKLWILVPVLLSLGAALAVIRKIPPIFMASTMVMVEAQRIPTEYVRPTVTGGMQERLRTIEQQIVNRENLERIIREMDLYSTLRETQPMETIVAKARADLALEVMGDSVFRISFQSRDAEEAAGTANRVAKLFIDENLRLRSEQARGTTEFLDDELEKLRLMLEEQEQRVASYRLANDGSLPEQSLGISQVITQLQSRLDDTQDGIDQVELKKLLLQRDHEPVEVVASNAQASAAAARLQQAEQQLLQLLASYTDQHPDVVRLRREIERLEQQAAREKLEEPEPAAGVTVESLDEISPELQLVEVEVLRLQTERRGILSEMDRYRRRLERIPGVELELQKLTRDYENLRSSYQALRAKRIDARLAENLELKQQSEQFIILERAVAPAVPFSPNRFRILLLTMVVSGGLGLGLALLREETDQRVVDEFEIRKVFPGARCLGSIPHISAANDNDRTRRVA